MKKKLNQKAFMSFPIRGRLALKKLLLMTKLTLLLIFLSFIQAIAVDSYAQMTRLSLKIDAQPLEKVLEEIEDESEFFFLYNKDLIDVEQKVSVNVQNETIKAILDGVLQGKDIAYTVYDRQIVLSNVDVIEKMVAQQKSVSGKVTDSSGSPLPGVTVVVKGTTQGTITDVDGKYTLTHIPDDATLQFSFVGMRTQEIIVGNQATLNVEMKVDAIGLEEVVAIGYGVQKKVNLTGAVSTVDTDELESIPTTNISSLLQGRMAGVTVTVNNGQPGRDEGTIRVRGIGTLGNSNAMVIVDGIVGYMNDINPSEIESISILKDATSAAIYGSRAANGVILITTKSGKSGGITAHYKMDFGKQTMTSEPDVLDSWQSSTLYNEALVNEGKSRKYSDEEIQKFRDGSDPEQYPNTDWLDLFWQGNGIQQNHFFDVSGGNEKTQSYLSMGYVSQNGLVEGTSLERYTTNFKIDNQLTAHIKLSAKLSYSQERFKEPISNIHSLDFGFLNFSARQIGRVVPLKINGYYGYSDEGNPVAMLKSGSHNFNITHHLSGIYQADVEIFKKLHIKPLLGYTTEIIRRKSRVNDVQYYNPYTGEPTVWQGPNRVASSNNMSDNLTMQILLQYDKTFGDHGLNFIGGYSQEHYKTNYLYGMRYGYLNNALDQLDAGPVSGQQNSGNTAEYALQSLFGRINYSFKEKYLLEGVIRDDGSSRFASSNRWAVFPSFSVGWRMSEEPFFEPIKNVVLDLKLRGSWGQLGNQDIGYYPYQATIITGQNYTFGGQSVDGISPVKGVNRDIKWETTTSTNFGLDAVLINGMITFTGDYFIRNTDDILLSLPVMASFGLDAPVINAGSVENKGFELTGGYHLKKSDFTFDVNANVSFIKNKITSLAGTGPFPSGFTIQSVGLPINALYGWVADGLFQSQEEIDNHADQSGMGGPVAPGDIKYKDLNSDGVINGNDRQYLGNYYPETTFGVNISAAYKGFDATLFIQGAADVKSYVADRILGSLYDKNGQPTSIWLDRWTPTNTDASFPRVWNSYTQNNPQNTPSSFWVHDASYVRLKNIQIGYTLPEKVLNSIGIQKIRIFWTGNNLLTFTNFYDWVDPESPLGGTNWTYPIVKVNSIGLNLTF